MVKRCLVIGCSTTSKKNEQNPYKSLFRVPIKSPKRGSEGFKIKTQDRHRKWIAAINRTIGIWTILNGRVCSDHFITGEL